MLPRIQVRRSLFELLLILHEPRPLPPQLRPSSRTVLVRSHRAELSCVLDQESERRSEHLVLGCGDGKGRDSSNEGEETERSRRSRGRLCELEVTSDLVVLSDSIRSRERASSTSAVELVDSFEVSLSILVVHGLEKVGDDDLFSDGDGSDGDEICEKEGERRRNGLGSVSVVLLYSTKLSWGFGAGR